MPKIPPVEVNADGTPVLVHPMSAGNYVRFHKYMKQKDADPVTADFMLIHFCCTDMDGKQLFATPQDAERISLEAANVLLPAVVEVNELAEKKSQSTPSTSSSTA